MNMRKVWAVDFDGTLCRNAWPDIGEANTELIEQLILARSQGVAVVLWSCREGEAAGFGLYFDAVNKNVPERVALYGADSRKVSADVYIDDRAQIPSTPWGGE